jgi:hypothetical protein
VTTLDPSESADATITGTSPAQVLNLDIPRGYTGATTIGDSGMAFETRAAIAGATIEAVRKYAYTAGYAAFGDGGHGLYKRMAAAPSDPSNPAYVRSVDRYKADGTTDATHGGYWQLVPQGGVIYIEQFGGAGDCTVTGTGGTDNSPPLTDAIAFFSWNEGANDRYVPSIKFGAANYRFSDGFDIHDHVHITGVPHAGTTQSATMLHFNGVQNPFILGSNNTIGDTGTGASGGTSDGSVLENLTISCASAEDPPVDLDCIAILMRSQSAIRNVSLFNLPGHGVKVIAGGSVGLGNANCFTIQNLQVHHAGGNYLWLLGNDANAGIVNGFNCNGSAERGGCGIRAENGYTNTLTGIHISGYGNMGVSHGGNWYQLINGTAGIGAATTPGTNNAIWYLIGAGGVNSRFPAWSAAADYDLLQLPIFDSGSGNVYIGPYVEAGSVFSHIASPALVLGSNAMPTTETSGILTFQSLTGNLMSKMPIGNRREFVSGTAEATQNGSETWVSVGGANEGAGFGANGGLSFLTHRRYIDGETSYQFGYRGNDIVYSFLGAKWLMSFTTAATTQQLGRGSAQPHYMMLEDLVLADASDYANSRVIGMRLARPTTGAHGAGEVFFTSIPADYGAAAHVCVTAGTPGTWGTIPVFGLDSVTPANNGDLVVECTSNTQLTFKYKGSDGVVRSNTLALS